MAEVWISTLQQAGAGAIWGALQLFKAHSLAKYGYFVQLTLFWEKIDALVKVHASA